MPVTPLFAPGTIPVLVLDACVLYRMLDTDTLLSLADEHLLVPRWSDTIEGEWLRNLAHNRPDLASSIAQRAATMNRVFPEARIALSPSAVPPAASVGTTDPSDLHVVSAALAAHAHAIVTHNLSDFDHRALAVHGVAVTSPDRIVEWLLRHEDKPHTHRALRAQRLRMQHPPVSPASFITLLRNGGFPLAAALLRADDL